MEPLVSDECGGPNALVKLANLYHRGATDQHGGAITRINGSMPTTFDMQQLLHQTQSIENEQDDIPTINQSKAHTKPFQHQNNYKAQHFESRYQQPFVLPPIPSQAPIMFPQLTRYSSQSQHDVLAENKWAHQYLENIEQKLGKDTNDFETPLEFLEKADKELDSETTEEWAKEFVETINTDEELLEPVTGADMKYWQELQEKWNHMFSQEELLNEEESYVDGLGVSEYNKDYSFEERNPFKGEREAFKLGLKQLEEGDLISAILLFEEAVQQDPNHAEAWQYLGTSQAENEQETLAIRALKKCIEVQPENLVARMALAVSYTNESLQNKACEALKSWIEFNPRYKNLSMKAGAAKHSTSQYSSSIMSTEMFNEVENLYLSAARLAPHGDLDAEIQVGLGVLYNISGDYSKALDCFKTALNVDPASANIWNKLGATLANSGNSAEAVQAYRNALRERPGFIRCRYNLGITCVNLKSYNEAVTHFLSALNMQRQGEDPNRAVSTMSENIWTTLRMTISLLGRLDLMKTVSERDLLTLNKEFNVS